MGIKITGLWFARERSVPRLTFCLGEPEGTYSNTLQKRILSFKYFFLV